MAGGASCQGIALISGNARNNNIPIEPLTQCIRWGAGALPNTANPRAPCPIGLDVLCISQCTQIGGTVTKTEAFTLSLFRFLAKGWKCSSLPG